MAQHRKTKDSDSVDVLINLGGLVVAIAVAFSYSGLITPAAQTPGPWLISQDGAHLEVYALAWLITSMFLIVDIIRRSVSWGTALFTGMMGLWTYAHIKAWWVSDFSSDDWRTAALYLGFSMVSFAACRAGARRQQLRAAQKATEETITGQIQQVKE